MAGSYTGITGVGVLTAGTWNGSSITDTYVSNDLTLAAVSGTPSFSGLTTFSAVPAGTGVNQGSLYINPATATADYTLLGLAVGGVQKFRLDADGDFAIEGDMAFTGSQTISTTAGDLVLNPTGNLALSSNSITGLGTGITASGALTVSTTGANNLTLSPGTGITTTANDFQITGGFLDVNTYADVAYTGASSGLTVAQSGAGYGAIITGGNVGIGSVAPEFKLSLDNDGGILAKGTFGSGNTLATAGAGTRLIWYPRKAAFRAGYVSGTQWNDASIGNYSVAMGDSTIASGAYSTAMGHYTTAGTADYTTAIGRGESGNVLTNNQANSILMGFQYTPGVAVDQTDILFKRAITGAANNLAGSVVKIENTSTTTGIDSTAVLTVAQSGSGDIVDFKDGATSIFTIAGDGSIIVAGQISYAGSGKPKRSIILTAGGAITPTTGGVAQTKADGTNHSYYELEYDDTTDESAYWHWTMPDSYDDGTIDITYYWEADATTGEVGWCFQAAGVAPNNSEDIDPSLSSAVCEVDTAQGNANDLASVTESAATSNFAVGEYVVFKVLRDADESVVGAGNDDMSGDARLVKIKIEYSVSTESD